MFENFTVPKELIPSDPRFGVGPSLIAMEHFKTLAETGSKLMGTSHRKSAVKNLVKEVQNGFRQYFNLPEDYQVVLGNGGATFLWDMMALGMVEKNSAHFVCGEFSDKWFRAHKKVPWIKAQEYKVDFGKGINPESKSDADMICTTLNETSTGVQISKLCEVNDKTILAVDATSGAGQIACDVSKTDMFYFSPQKVFAGEGGLFFAFMSPKAIERTEKIAADKSRYIPVVMEWKLAIDNSKENQTYNTPGITGLYLVNEQLKAMNKLGFAKVEKEAKRKADMIYSWAEKKDYLSPFIEQNEFRSQAVATINLDEKFSADDLIKKLRDLKVVYDIDSYRKLGKNQFRISLFHNVTYENLEKLTKIISLAIES
ncbi:MAG: phosphoserine transaminase [Bacteriovoracaceae bacterium]|nr:phosphoserine transaminase [Bacteriovoracaceae bacterium]